MTDPRPVPHPQAPSGAREVAALSSQPSLPGADGAPHLQVVEAPDASAARRRAGVRMLVAGGVAIAVAIVFSLVFLHVMAAQNQLRLQKLTHQAAEEQLTYQRLRLKVAELESPAHIISTAVGKLGMRQPATVTYLTPSGPAAAALAGQPGSVASASGGSQAVAGDADWPAIKSQLTGSQ